MIYLDSAATSMHKPQVVVDAVTMALTTMGNAGRGLNEASMNSAKIIYETRELLAKLFNAESPSQIAFTCNSTESLNIAIKGTLRSGDYIIRT